MLEAVDFAADFAGKFTASFLMSYQDRSGQKVSAHKRQQRSDDKLDRDAGTRNKRPRIGDVGG